MSGDLPETVAELRRLVDWYETARADYYRNRDGRCGGEFTAAEEHLAEVAARNLPAILDAADLALLLARVEERWPVGVLHWYYPEAADDRCWIAAIRVNGEKVARGEGPSRAAALRALLGEEVSGG